MSAWIIYDKNGLAKCEARKLTYSGEFLGACSVSVNITSPTPIGFSIGDWLEYRGERFELNYDPSVVKDSSLGGYGEGFVYENVVFNSLSDELTRCDFLDVVPSDNGMHYSSLPTFSFFAENIYALVERIQANLDRVYKADKAWTLKIHPEYTSDKNANISASNLTCWDALALVHNTFGANFTIKGRTITIGASGIAVGNLFSYGKGNGLYSIERNAESNQKIITRLRAYGSTRNMPTGYYRNIEGGNVPNNMAVTHLMLPSFPSSTLDPYIDSKNLSELGVREGTVFFDGSGDLEEIYPTMEGITAEDLKSAGINVDSEGFLDEVVSAEQIADDGIAPEEGEIQATFTITIKDVGFDINEHLSTSGNATISMKNGMCGGREFEIVECKKEESNYVLTCNRVEDASLGLYFPYKDYQIKKGDKFVLLNLEMPDVYIKAASQRLLSAATGYLAKNDYVRYSFTPRVDNIMLAKQHDEAVKYGLVSIHDTIKEGDFILFEDNDLGVSGSITIDALSIKENAEESLIPEYEITLKEEKTVGTIEKIQNQISSILNGSAGTGGTGGGVTNEQVKSILEAIGGKMFLSKQKDDKTPYKLNVGGKLTAEKGIQIGKSFVPGILTGSGGYFDEHANGEVESLIIRRFLEVPELRFNRVQVTLGDKWNAPGAGVIERVVPDSDTTGTVFLKLEEGEYGAIAVGDICMGIFHSEVASENATEDYDDSRGNFQFAGFYTCYFRITGITGKDNKQFTYSMRPTSDRWKLNYHPREAMHFVCYGNFTNTDRQTSAYTTRTYTRLLKNQNDWEISSKNIAMQWGDMGNMSIHGMDMKGYSIYTTNIYNKGIIKQVKDNGEEILTANDRGAWVIGTTYDYYDRVSYNGSLWLCVNENGTNSEPTKTNSDWLLQVASGDSLTAGGRFSSANVPYSPNSIVDFADKAWITTDTVSDAPYPIWTDNNGNRLMFSDGGFCLVDDSAVNTGWEVLLDTGTLKDGEDGKSLIVQWSADGVNWHDEFTTGDIYMRQKVGEDAVWSDAIRVAGEKGAAGENGEYTEYEFAVNDSVDTAPTSGWADIPPTVGKGQYLWMRMRVVQGDGTAGNWSVPVRIGGEKGDSVEFVGRFYTGLKVPYLGIVQMGNANWAAKKATFNPPLWCWTDENGNRLQFSDGGFIITGEENTEYELMVANGKDGSDGNEYEYIYINTTTNNQPSTPTTEQVDDFVPSGWHDDPAGVSSDIPYEWVSQRRKKNGIWGDFSNPSVWAKYGEDGTNWEFIYQRAIEYYIPSTPETRQQDDYVPSGWTDDPTGVSESVPYEWMSKRAKKNGIWGAFSTPALWAKYGEKGQKGDKGDTGGVGYTGCVTRVFQEYDLNRNYRNDTNAPSDELEPSGIRYLDVVLVPNDNVTSGYDAYECLITNTGISLKNTEYWREMSNAGSQFIPKLVALDAHIRFASSGQLVILDENNEPCAGLSGSQDGHKIRIWAGSYYMQTAPFRVTQEGHLIANNATITGVIKGATIEGELIVGTGAYKAKINPSGTYPSITWGDDSHPYVWIGMNTPTGGYLSGQITLKNVLNSSAILTPSSIMLTGDHNFGVEINASGINESRISATRFIAGGGRYIASIGLDTNNRIRLGASYWPTSSSQVNVGEVYSDNGTLKIRTT